MKKRNTSPIEERITLYPKGNGTYTAYLRDNIVPITMESEEEGSRVEFECDLYIVDSPFPFRDEVLAMEWFEDNFEGLILYQNELEEQEKIQKKAQESLLRLNKTDYKVIKAMEEFLRSQGIDVRPESEEWRKNVRQTR